MDDLVLTSESTFGYIRYVSATRPCVQWDFRWVPAGLRLLTEPWVSYRLPRSSHSVPSSMLYIPAFSSAH